jgi:hypothetical protein
MVIFLGGDSYSKEKRGGKIRRKGEKKKHKKKEKKE